MVVMDSKLGAFNFLLRGHLYDVHIYSWYNEESLYSRDYIVHTKIDLMKGKKWRTHSALKNYFQ